MRSSLLVAVATVAAMAQTKVDVATQTKNIDFSSAGATKPVKTGTDLPTSCAVGELFFKTSSPAGANLFACTAPHTWSVQAGNGAGGSIGVAASGALVGVRPTVNLIPGPGIQSVLVDTGSQINVESHIDTATVQSQAGEQSGAALLCASASGNSRDYQCGLSPTASEYAKGMVLHWIPDVAAAGGATSMNVDGLGAVSLKMPDGVTDPSAADIVAGRMYSIWHDGLCFRLLAATGTSGGGGVGSSVSSVFGRTGAVTAQSGDYTKAQVGLGNVLNVAQEPALGNPDTDGKVLASTAAGVRSWIVPPSAAAWGGITGALSSQTDLSGALAGKAGINAATTVNGQTCALGSACTVTDSSKEPANANIQAHITNLSNPHSVTKSQVGLGSVDNTSDSAKPISTATQAALNLKAAATASTTVNGQACALGSSCTITTPLLAGWGFCATAACSNTDVIANPYIATDTRMIGACYIASGTAPVGADLVVQVKKNGVNAFTVNQTAGHNYDKTAAANIGLVEGDVLTATITQVGSTVAGQNVTVICKVN